LEEESASYFVSGLQEDLVDVAHRLLPLINVKGFDTKSKSGYRGKKKNKKQ
jgi:hypothetical protein